MITIGSLFSGIGGLELGLEWAGLGPVRWQIEIDPHCSKILARHWPNATRHRDVHDVGGHNLAPVDIICGGFPCQPASVAGKRRGRDDERWLWGEYARIIRELQPRIVVAENVPGLLTVDGGAAFGEVVGDLAALGYDTRWDRVRVSDVGGPHQRARVFIVAVLADSGRQSWQPGAEEPRVSGQQGDPGGPVVQGQPVGVGTEHRTVGLAYPASAGASAAEQRGQGRGSVAGGEAVAYADGERQRQPQGLVADFAGRTLDCGQRVGVGQADPDGARLEVEERESRDAGPQRPPASRGRRRSNAGAAEPGVGREPDGLPAGLDGIARENGAESVAEEEEVTGGHEELRELRRGVTPAHVSERAQGQPQHARREAVLRSQMRGAGFGATDGLEVVPLPSIGALPVEDMRWLQEHGATPSSSSGWGQHEQCRVEPDDVVRLLSREVALDAWGRTVEATLSVSRMRVALARLGAVRQALHEIEAAWRNLSHDQQRWLVACALGESLWPAPPGPQKWFEPPRTLCGVANRIHRLRALGNAVSPQVAYVIGCVVRQLLGDRI